MEIRNNNYWKNESIHLVTYKGITYKRNEVKMYDDFHTIAWRSEDGENLHYYYSHALGWSDEEGICGKDNPPPYLEIEFKKTMLPKREEFIDRGWVFMSEFDNRITFTKGDVYKDNGQGAFLSVKDNHISISTTDEGYNQDGPNISVKFNGECNTPAEFDMICKMIGLKS